MLRQFRTFSTTVTKQFFPLSKARHAVLLNSRKAKILPQRQRMYKSPVCPDQLQLRDMGIMEYLRFEERKRLDPSGERWALFKKESPKCISTGSLLRLTYRVSRTTPTPVNFTGVLLAIRRSPGDPTIVVRGIVDDIGVEQIFCIFNPLIEKIEVLKAAPRSSTKKLYSLREKPADILRVQKLVKAEEIKEAISQPFVLFKSKSGKRSPKTAAPPSKPGRLLKKSVVKDTVKPALKSPAKSVGKDTAKPISKRPIKKTVTPSTQTPSKKTSVKSK